jgi:hypothetical protein
LAAPEDRQEQQLKDLIERLAATHHTVSFLTARQGYCGEADLDG